MRPADDHDTGRFTGLGDRAAAAGAEGRKPPDSRARRLSRGHAVNHCRCEALFASTLQESDTPSPQAVADAISSTIRQLGPAGCASRMAQEFGDHPEQARDRMRWARQLLGQLSAPSRIAPGMPGAPAGQDALSRALRPAPRPGLASAA